MPVLPSLSNTDIPSSDVKKFICAPSKCWLPLLCKTQTSTPHPNAVFYVMACHVMLLY